MTFTLPDVTALLAVVVGVAALAVAVSAVGLGTVLAEHRTIRIRRQQGAARYYGHLVLGH